MAPKCVRLLMVVAVCFWGAAWVPAQQVSGNKLVVKNAYVFTMAAGQRAPFHGYLVVGRDGRLVTVAPGEPAAGLVADETVDAGGQWVIPGFLSAHSHLWQSAFRGLAGDSTLPNWLTAVYTERGVKAKPEDFYWFTLSGAIDHLQHGITGAYNFNYGGGTHGSSWADGNDAQEFRAEMDSGLRFVHGIDVGQATPAGAKPFYGAEQARVRLKSFLDWVGTQPGTRSKSSAFLSVMINGYVGFSNHYEQAVMEKSLVDEFHLGDEEHYLEAPEDQYEQQSKFRWFLESGLLSRGVIFGHFIHTNRFILEQSVKAGASMSWNPLSNGRLASGVADIPVYLKAGMRVGMGVDGEASADLADPFENMRTGLYAIRDKYEDATVMSPYDVLRLHTMGSADVLGVADRAGSLEAGKFGDFLFVDPSRFGPVVDPYASLVFIADERDLKRVYVGGEMLVKDGVLVKVDQGKVQGEVNRRVAGLR